MARILIADDRESMRSALRTVFVLRPDWEICGEAIDGIETVAKATQLQPDLVLIDFRMHLSDGLTAATELNRIMPSVPIVMYTLYKTDELEAAAKLVGSQGAFEQTIFCQSVMVKKQGARRCVPLLEFCKDYLPFFGAFLAFFFMNGLLLSDEQSRPARRTRAHAARYKDCECGSQEES